MRLDNIVNLKVKKYLYRTVIRKNIHLAKIVAIVAISVSMVVIKKPAAIREILKYVSMLAGSNCPFLTT